jgi:hypothetical protein
MTDTTYTQTNLIKMEHLAVTGIVQLGLCGTCTETRFRLLAKVTSPSDVAGVTVQSATGSQGAQVSW